MGGGDNGGGGKTQFEWNDEIKPYWVETLKNASNAASQPFTQYGGQRIAFKDPKQQEALDGIRNFAWNPYGASQFANEQIQDTLGDDYLTGPKSNTYAEARNVYSGEGNPYFGKVLNQGMDNIANKYMDTTAAETTRMFNQAGAFGGSAYEKAVANNQAGLAKQLSDYDSGMRNDQYNRSAGLEESFLSRGSNAFEGERGRQMSALAPGQNDQALTLQRLQALMGAGDIDRGYQQQFMDMNYGDWRDSRDWGKNQSSWMGGMLSGAQGGLPPSQFQSFQQPGSNNFSNIMGTALAGYGMFRA